MWSESNYSRKHSGERSGDIEILDRHIYGPHKIILGADIDNGYIAIHGWQTKTDTKLHDFLVEFTQLGIQYCICTDIQKDGMLSGSSIELYKEILQQHDVHLIASGGVTSIEECYALQEVGCYGAIIGKAIYENRISLKDIENWMINAK